MKKKNYCLWNLVFDGLILISFKSIDLFLPVFSVAGLGSWESISLSMTSLGFGRGPWWAVATLPDVPSIQPSRHKHLPDQPSRSTHSLPAQPQQTALLPQGETLAKLLQAAKWQDSSWSQETFSPWSLQTRPSMINSQNCPQCVSSVEQGIETTQSGSVSWHCIRIYTSASLNLLKEVTVLPRKLKANRA